MIDNERDYQWYRLPFIWLRGGTRQKMPACKCRWPLNCYGTAYKWGAWRYGFESQMKIDFSNQNLKDQCTLKLILKSIHCSIQAYNDYGSLVLFKTLRDPYIIIYWNYYRFSIKEQLRLKYELLLPLASNII